MASYHFNNRRSHNSLLSNIGNKVKHVAEFAGAVKGIYDVGKMIYHGARAISPIASAAGLLI
jgi:hypothetical protein